MPGGNPYGTNGPIQFDPFNYAPNPYFTGHENSEGGWAWDSQSPNDPRLHLGGNQPFVDGNMVPIGQLTPDQRAQMLFDPSAVTHDDQYGDLTTATNLKSNMDTRAGDLTFALGVAGLGAFVAPAIMAGNGFGAGAGAMDAIQAGENVGTAAGGATMDSGAGSLSSMYSGGPPDSYWNMTADSGGVASDAGGGYSQALGDGGGIDPETWAGNGGMGVSQNGLGSWNALPWQDRVAGLAANPGSAFSSTGMPAQLASGGLGSGAKDPMRLLQLANLMTSMGAGLGGHGDDGDNGPTSLGSMGWKPPSNKRSQSYDKRYGSPYAGWVEQYLASLKPLRSMYGHG